MDVQLEVVYDGGWEAAESRSVDTLDWRIGLPAIVPEVDFKYTGGVDLSIVPPG